MSRLLQANSYRCYLTTRNQGWKWRSSRFPRYTSVSSKSRTNPLESIGKLTPGDELYGYTVKSVTSLPEFDAKAAQLIHNKTQASHLHIGRIDPNNTFSVGFRTTPNDNMGVAHILEHTTLCGSRKFPIRDPFFKMLTRSLTSFMNAFTASDWTMYPFCSPNSKDFSNLLLVYLDCVFFPRLRELDFKQEGWRLEHKNPQDSSSPIIFKGVVFNEMKGAFTSSESIFIQALQNHLLPSHTYSHVSGGKPLDILDLSWEALKEFHKTHYHPTNAHFFTYGDIPLEDHLQIIDKEVLMFFSNGPLSPAVPFENRWHQPKTHRIHCSPDPLAAYPEKQTTVSVAFLQASNTDPYESMVLSILGHLLVDGPSSPFYQALLEANIGSDYAPNTGYDNSTLDTFFSIGLQGIKEGDAKLVEGIIMETLKTVFEKGFPEEEVRAVLHQVELAVKHQSSNFGLGLATSVISPWIHGGDPVTMLQINRHVEIFKENLKSEGYLQEKVKEYFLSNNHRLTLVMTPDVEYGSVLQSAEQEKLTKFVSRLTEVEKEKLFADGLELLEDQNSKVDADCLPSVLLTDIDKEMKYTKLNQQHSGGIPVQYTEQPTNGLTYFKGISSLSLIPDELKIYIPLFCNVITRMGAGDVDYRQFSLQCDLYSGGLNVSPHLCGHHTTVNGYDQGVLFLSHCLSRHVPHMFSLWEDVFTRPNLSHMERLKTLVRMSAASLAMDVAHSGHIYAMTSSSSGLTPSSKLSELFNGMTQVQFLKEIGQSDDLTDVLQKFALIAAEVFDCGSLRCAINTNDGSCDQVQMALDGWINTLPGSRADVSSYTEDNLFSPTESMIYYQMPFPVHYIGQSFPTVPFTHEDSPRLSVLAKLLSSKFLHKEIREKGGAYGSGAVHQDGVFSFMSYRDPNCLTTLDCFKKSAEWASMGEFSEQDVTESLLSVFSKVDSPVSPGAKGNRYFLTSITDEMQQRYREQLFNVDKSTLQETAEKYLVNNKIRSCAVIGPKNEEVGTPWKVKTFDL